MRIMLLAFKRVAFTNEDATKQFLSELIFRVLNKLALPLLCETRCQFFEKLPYLPVQLA